ncbi:MAG: hypothetical protein KDI46_06575 [Alphaproteobacteria bacterium]|nr:hypothetical protein [Alphaproteobacteria bacterium]
MPRSRGTLLQVFSDMGQSVRHALPERFLRFAAADNAALCPDKTEPPERPQQAVLSVIE